MTLAIASRERLAGTRSGALTSATRERWAVPVVEEGNVLPKPEVIRVWARWGPALGRM